MVFEGSSVLLASEVLLPVYWPLVSIRQYHCCMRDGVMVKWSLDWWGVDLYRCGGIGGLWHCCLSFWMGKVYPDFPYFCGPVGITPPSRVEVASRRYMVGGVVTREGCCWVCCCGNRCSSSYRGVKRKFFYACVCVCLWHGEYLVPSAAWWLDCA